LAVPKSNPNTIYVFKKNTPLIKEKSQFYRTLDAGKTWEFYDSDLYSDSYITYLIVDDKNPDRLWATLSNFTAGRKILYSSDGGKTWENITYNLPNLPANSVVYQSDEKTNILYAAMDIGVYYLIEGSNEWKPLMGNLPNVIVHELEINYTTKKLYAATFGRGIWITDLLTETLPSANSIYEAEVIVYPNPAKGDVFVKADYSEVEKIQIVDVLGRIVHEEELKPKALRFGKKLDLNENLKGLFYIRLIQGDKSKVVRLWRE
jgi:photosystem II stability/assembly factor-like uncharacterized protein